MLLQILTTLILAKLAASGNDSFVFNGFHGANLSLNGIAEITASGLLQLTNNSKQSMGHAFYPIPLHFKNTSAGSPLSFSTTFVFAIVPEFPDVSAHGLALALSPSKQLSQALPSQHLGLFNLTNNGNSTNHIVAIELDHVQSTEFGDINDNHVGIDVNGLRSIAAAPVSYHSDQDGGFRNLSLISGAPMQIWVEYNSFKKELNVTLAPISIPKPKLPLLSSVVDLSDVLLDHMYVGFSSSTGEPTGYHYILGWSFSLNGKAQELDLSLLPSVPRIRAASKKPWVLIVSLPLAILTLVLLAIVLVMVVRRRREKFAEILDDWEHEYGPHRFSYKDLFRATRGFAEENLLGVGGFGRVYRGVLPSSSIEVAVKRVSHESKQGIREFVAEIVSIGRLRHRNLVQLLGYCRREGELLLVYDFMCNGSLDKLLFDQNNSVLTWNHRFRIIKGVAAGLLYLHEGWEQVVLHRDIKASNVLLDGELNGKLGDFGLARLYDHGTNPKTSHVVGTFGYIAPELTRTGKATTWSDVFAFGMFLLEVACGRRPIELKGEKMVLVDWVVECFKRGAIFDGSDPKLEGKYEVEEMALVLKLGLLCSHPVTMVRPSMRQVMQFLDGGAVLPEMPVAGMVDSILDFGGDEGFDDYVLSYRARLHEACTSSSSMMASVLSGGR